MEMLSSSEEEENGTIRKLKSSKLLGKGSKILPEPLNSSQKSYLNDSNGVIRQGVLEASLDGVSGIPQNPEHFSSEHAPSLLLGTPNFGSDSKGVRRASFFDGSKSFWREYYIVLLDSRLIFYENEEAHRLQQDCEVIHDISLSKSFPAIIYGEDSKFVFQLSVASMERVLFRARSRADQKIWIEAIRRAAFNGTRLSSYTSNGLKKDIDQVANGQNFEADTFGPLLAEMVFIGRLSQIQSQRLYTREKSLSSYSCTSNLCEETSKSRRFLERCKHKLPESFLRSDEILLEKIQKAQTGRLDDQRADFLSPKTNVKMSENSFDSGIENLTISDASSISETIKSSKKNGKRHSFLKILFNKPDSFHKRNFEVQTAPPFPSMIDFHQNWFEMHSNSLAKEISANNFDILTSETSIKPRNSVKKVFSTTHIESSVTNDKEFEKSTPDFLLSPANSDQFSSSEMNFPWTNGNSAYLGDFFGKVNVSSSDRLLNRIYLTDLNDFIGKASHFRASTPLVEGFMSVFDPTRHCWHRRYCSIEDGMLLVRKHCKTCSPVLHSICVLFAQVSRVSLPKKDFCIQIAASSKALILQASSEKLQSRWIEIIRLAVIDAIKYRPSTEIAVKCQYQDKLRKFYLSRNIAFDAFLPFLKTEFDIVPKFCNLCYKNSNGKHIQVKNQNDLDEAFLDCEGNELFCFYLSIDQVFFSEFQSSIDKYPEFKSPQPIDRSSTQDIMSPLTNTSKTMNFVFGEIIGRGAFSIVRSALNPETGEMVAVKQVRIPGGQRNAASHLELLRNEIEVLEQLNHPNIVRHLGVSQDGDCLNVFLELVGGGTLQTAIKDYGPFDEVLIRRYTRQICRGLKYLHDRSIVHRDIKSANILVETRGSAKLADFGAAVRLLNGEFTKELCGTPYWMAPEVIRQEAYGKPADIWSLACTIIEMSTKHPPWHEFTEHLSAMYHIATTSDAPEIPTWLSEDAHYLLSRCFERDPEKRPSIDDIMGFPFLSDEVDPKDLVSYRPPQCISKSQNPDSMSGILSNLPSPTRAMEVIYSDDEFETNLDSLLQYDMSKFPPYLYGSPTAESLPHQASDRLEFTEDIVPNNIQLAQSGSSGSSPELFALSQSPAALSTRFENYEFRCGPSILRRPTKLNPLTTNEYM